MCGFSDFYARDVDKPPVRGTLA